MNLEIFPFHNVENLDEIYHDFIISREVYSSLKFNLNDHLSTSSFKFDPLADLVNFDHLSVSIKDSEYFDYDSYNSACDSSFFSVIFNNIRSIPRNLEKFHLEYVQNLKFAPSIIGFCETKLCGSQEAIQKWATSTSILPFT